ncbi:TonB-dependent siderophore receptor [Nostoc sp. LPT]|uniref:TonB-dependent siderophore receptor n=1 Tax=Nostoc sp. LPT TaxID=2815387 RepID=UPI001D50811D|nr:TonB-dependent siderophore receptor [Nostoc sp. LPT]MBN4004794.1 TonB-dependent siderophore receptor [Nostoc sp. LPT]
MSFLRQVLQDQGSFRVQDAVRNVGGQPGTNFGRSGETFILRGFTQSNNYLRNGVRDAKAISGIVIPTTNIERIEVLRGPASVLYGFGDPGGTINIVTKQPLTEPYYAFEFASGSFDFYQPAIDISGPLTDDKKLLYRLNASYYNADGSTDLFRKEYYFVSPVISWQIGKNTNLTFEADYTDLQLRELWGQPAEGTVLPNRNGKIPRDRSIIEPTDFSNRRTARIGYRFKHSFSENWSLSNAFQAWIWRQEQYNTTATRLEPDGRTLERTTQINASSTDAINGGTTNWSIFTLDTNVVGKFQTGGIQHQLLMGFDLYKDVQGPFARIFRATQPIDLYNPVYGQPLGRVTSATNAKTRLDNLGLYVQDQIALTDNLKLVLGGRYDLSTSIITDYVASSVFTQPDEAFSPQVGVVYQPSKTVSLYANYNRSFLQITGTTAFSGSRAADGSFFTPQRGTQYEVGIKTDFLDGKLSTNLALYEVTLSNVLTIDPSNPRLSVQVGEQQSQGVEFNVAGEILPGWNIIAAYAYTDAKVSKDINRSRIGNRLPNVPENGFSLWTTYTISQRELKGLGFGLGLLYVGERQGDLLNSFQLPSYLRTDAAVFYRNNKFRLGVNFKNLFNIDYVDIGGSSLSIFRGDPFNAVVTLDWQF